MILLLGNIFISVKADPGNTVCGPAASFWNKELSVHFTNCGYC